MWTRRQLERANFHRYGDSLMIIISGRLTILLTSVTDIDPVPDLGNGRGDRGTTCCGSGGGWYTSRTDNYVIIIIIINIIRTPIKYWTHIDYMLLS